MSAGFTDCDHCGLKATKEGHDGCLGELPGPVMNACCGHGQDEVAYIQFDNEDYKNDSNKNLVSGKEAVYLQNLLKTTEN